MTRIAAPVNEFIKALVIAEDNKDPVPEAGRSPAVAEGTGTYRPANMHLEESQRQYEKGKVSRAAAFLVTDEDGNG